MREILFRGKRKDNGEWVEGYYVNINSDLHYIYTGYAETDVDSIYPDCFIVIPETVGQYTGLCDKNENMIFEGDIVQFDDNHYEVRRECDTPGGYWAETGYILDHIGWNDYIRFTDTIDEYNNEICVEVIGNIHDNPELLKGGKDDEC